jgi:Pentapeptide repeats (8 copies)
MGLDLCGADLSRVNLRNLPLTRMRSGLSRDEWNLTTLEQRHMAGVRLQGADLSEAHLEDATLRGTYYGRGFFPGPFALGDPVTALAAVEVVMGLFIEISFIATFTQRFFW